MRKIIFIVFLLSSAFNSDAQWEHQGINFLGQFDDSNVIAEPYYGIRYQACWGWTDGNGKEYGIIGSTSGTYIIDVTDPANPIKRDYVATHVQNCIWHEYKTYGKYLYIISDDSGNNSFQIADLSYLPDSVHVVYDSTDLFVHAHTIFIDRDKLYIGSVNGTFDYSSMNVYSLSNPEHPTLLRKLDQDYSFIGTVHDMFVMNDTVYASCGYDGLYIFLYDTLLNKFNLLGSLQDANFNYNHSSVLSPDHKTLYVCEEVPDGRPVKVIDVTEISQPALLSTFYSNPGATPHNPLLIGNNLMISYYQDGIYSFDISSPLTPVVNGFFDHYPDNLNGNYDQPAYSGGWSAYADLPSGTILSSDTKHGLFCLDASEINGINKVEHANVNLFPNPSDGNINVEFEGNFDASLYDLNGINVFSSEKNNNRLLINVSGFTKGVYVMKIFSNEKLICKKIVIE